MALSAEPLGLHRTVLEDKIAFLVALELPWFDEDDVAFAHPQAALETARDAAVARLAIETTHLASRTAEPLLKDTEDLRAAR